MLFVLHYILCILTLQVHVLIKKVDNSFINIILSVKTSYRHMTFFMITFILFYEISINNIYLYFKDVYMLYINTKSMIINNVIGIIFS